MLPPEGSIMIQSWEDILLAAGYRKASTNDHYISPSGTHYSPEEIARFFGEAMSKTANPLTNAYLQAQAYNAQNNAPSQCTVRMVPYPPNQAGLAQYQNPQHHGLASYGSPPNMVFVAPSVPSSIYPLPTGLTAEAKIYDPALDEWVTIHIDTAFLPVLDYINDTSQQRQAKINKPDDFSLDEVRQAEDMIAELNID